MGLHSTASTGSRLDSLTALRDQLATQLDICESARDYAALSLRFMDVLEQIEECEKTAPGAHEGTALDEFTRRRKDRNAASASGPAKRNQRG